MQRVVQEDCENVAGNIFELPLRAVQNTFSIIAQSTFLLARCPGMFYRSAIIAVIGAPASMLIEQLVDIYRRRDDRVLRQMSTKTDEMLRNFATVREFAREDQEEVEYDRCERNKTAMSMWTGVIGMVPFATFITIMFFGRVWCARNA